MPPSNYVFPHNVVIKLGKPSKKFAQRSHLEKFHWLVLSHVDQGLYCKYCALFATTATDFARSNLRRLVKEPLKVFDRLLGENGLLIQHQRNHYHQMAVESGKNFLACYHKPELDIVNQISTQRMAQIMENRDRLRPIIKTIIFCGRQNIPLRGHRDDGQFFSTNTDKSVVSAPEGNFRALLKFRIDAGDTVLQHHLATASSNVTYISKTVQNELIDICKEKIQENILQNVKNAKFFSLLFDETTDISHTEQLSLSFRYYNNGVIKEDFICFCDAYEMLRCEEADSSKELRLTGVALAKIVENLCHKFDIDLTFCVGIGTDSCSVMASDVKGAVQELTKKAIHAKRCPCNNHVLNNSLANSSKVASCRNTSATMKKIVAFANASAKRHEVFLQELGGVAIQSICETRWVERHDGHLQFQGDNLIKICNALERISTWKDSKTSSDAHCLLQTLRSSDFIISSVCLNDILENVDSVFQQLFSEAREVAKQLDVELKSSRTISRQTHRSNHPAQSVEEYIRRSIYVPLLDCVINDLSQRLSPDVLDLFQLGVFHFSRIKIFRSYYIALQQESRLTFISDITSLAYEWRMLPIVFDDANKTLLANLEIDEVWKTIFQEKKLNNELFFPNLENLVNAVLSLPHSNAEAKRIFSIVTDVKNKKRNQIDVTSLDTVCKVRSSFQAHNVDSRTFQVDSTHLELYNYKNLVSPNSDTNQYKEQQNI
ncbi:52 kDa repressor of the inhibitor of the protein kinase [Trachymyrmex cornetzi]|uniref:52 kDa repressor of the inhibitor of the protein kinase n=1 Tax=Trachymyrmex cornetzi TaxID=471704 RepID=A0A151IZR8_9HYME|nr:52 kDa repressor of the inhibitor of the protein kinase [Trachymyrmex cornetzi]